MSTQTGFAIFFVLVVFVVVLYALTRFETVRQKLRLPGVSWDLEAKDKRAVGAQSVSTQQAEKDTSQTANASSIDQGIHWGKGNLFAGDVGDIAGQNIVDSPKALDTLSSKEQTSSVQFGEDNTFLGTMGDVAGGSIVRKDEKDENRKKGK